MENTVNHLFWSYLRCSGSLADTSWSQESVWAGAGTYTRCSPDTHTSSACSAALAERCLTVLWYLQGCKSTRADMRTAVRIKSNNTVSSLLWYLGLRSWLLSCRHTPHCWSSTGGICERDRSASPSPPYRPHWNWPIDRRFIDTNPVSNPTSWGGFLFLLLETNDYELWFHSLKVRNNQFENDPQFNSPHLTSLFLSSSSEHWNRGCHFKSHVGC